jgi:two-component system response regulator FlrC
MDLLESYDYSGNVRELLNMMERAIILCDEGGIIQPEHILLEPPEHTSPNQNNPATSSVPLGLSEVSSTVLYNTRLAHSHEVNLPPESPSLLQFRAGDQPMAEIYKEVILATLKRFQGNQTKTAEALGLSPRTIRNKLKEYSANNH